MNNTIVEFVGGLFFVLYGIGFVLTLWWVIRGFVSDQPEVNNSTPTILRAMSLPVPILCQLIGFYYIFYGPTRERSEKRIGEWLNTLELQDIAEWIDEQILHSSAQKYRAGIFAQTLNQNLRDDPWFKEHWVDQSPKERIALLKRNEPSLLLNIRKHLISFSFNGGSALGDSNWAMAFRDTVDQHAETMAKGIYEEC